MFIHSQLEQSEGGGVHKKRVQFSAILNFPSYFSMVYFSLFFPFYSLVYFPCIFLFNSWPIFKVPQLVFITHKKQVHCLVFLKTFNSLKSNIEVN